MVPHAHELQGGSATRRACRVNSGKPRVMPMARAPVRPRTATEGLQQHQRMMKASRPVPHQMACAQPQPGRRIRNPCWPPDSYLWRSVQPIHASRAWLQRRRRKRRQRHPLAAPRRAILPFVPITARNRASSSGNTAPSVTCVLHPVPAPMQPLFKDLYRNSSRHRGSAREQKSALPGSPDCAVAGAGSQRCPSTR